MNSGLFLKRVACFVIGHRCEATGRHGYLLHEWSCTRCRGLYISHIHHGNMLIAADADTDRIFKDRERLR